MFAFNITVSGGTLTGEGGEAIVSHGVFANSDSDVRSIKAENGGSITGKGGTATASSYGVEAGVVEMTDSAGGTIKCTGGTAEESIGGKFSTLGIGTGNFRLEGKGNNKAFTFILVASVVTGVSLYRRNAENGTYVQSKEWSNGRSSPYYDVRSALPTLPSIKVSVPAFGMMQAPENETVTVNSDDGINATDNFLSAQMDGKTIDVGSVGSPGAHGSVSDGSIVIQLNKTYLDKLSAGTHTLRVNLTGVYAEKFVEAQITVQSSGDVPETGDSATPMLWLGMLLLAGAGLAASAVRRRKRQNG